MQAKAPTIKITNYYEAAECKFTELTETLKDHHTRTMNLSELEKLLQEEGRELLRLMLQGHLNARGQGHAGLGVEGADDVFRTHKRIGARQLKSIFGEVELERLGYSKPGAESLFPKDSQLNLPKNSYSYELQRRVALEIVKGSFDNAVESINESTGVPVPKQQVEHITVQASSDFDAFYQANITPEKLKEAKEAPLLVLTTDGKGIVMHKDDLRPSTKKKAEAENKKLETRLSPGEKRNSKRMATVASVYNIDRFIRNPEDFKNELASIKMVKEVKRPKPLAKRVWASVEKPPEKVVEEMFEEGLRRDPEKKQEWIVLVDGAPVQIDRIEAQAASRGIELTIVCDIIHVIEYLWKAAWALFDKGDRKAEEWVNERFIAILEGKSSLVAAGIRRTATNRKLSKANREAIDTCSDYLLNKGPYLKYNEYLAKGYPIASGIIEGACRHLIKDRMDITGARWRIKSAEAVLRLRSLKASGDFKDYWAFHEEQEFIRNHKSKYKNPSAIDLQLKIVK
jgi:hypothetical protein